MSMSVDWDKCPDADEITSEQEDVLERIAETLPEKTHEWDACMAGLTLSEEEELIADAKELVKDTFPNITVEFHEDSYST